MVDPFCLYSVYGTNKKTHTKEVHKEKELVCSFCVKEVVCKEYCDNVKNILKCL